MRWLLPLLVACTEPPQKAEDTATDGGTPTTVDTGTRIASQIEVTPLAVDFGAIPPGCDTTATIEIRNSGNYPLEILEYELAEDPWGVFAVNGETTVIGPDASTTATVLFEPRAPQLYDGAFLRIMSDDSDDFRIDVTLVGEGQADEPAVDSFVQGDGRSVDILLALDDAADMTDRLEALADEAGTLLDLLELYGVDYHVAVIDLEADHGAAFLGPVVTPATADGGTVLGDAIRAAVGGSATPAFFDVVQAAVTEPLISGDNAGFLRADSFFTAVAYSTRDDDVSSMNGSEFSSWLATLRDPTLTTFSGVTGPRGGPLPCNPFGDSVDPAPRLGTAIETTRGLHLMICDYAAPAIVQDLAVFGAGLQSAFPLTRPVTEDDWMFVTVDGYEVPRDNRAGWSYAAGANEVLFHGSAVPLPGQSIEVNYPTAVPCP